MTNTSDTRIGALLRHNVRRLCEEKGISEPDLYRAAGLTSQQYSITFKREKGPTIATLERFAGTLGVHVSELLKPIKGATQ